MKRKSVSLKLVMLHSRDTTLLTYDRWRSMCLHRRSQSSNFNNTLSVSLQTWNVDTFIHQCNDPNAWSVCKNLSLPLNICTMSVTMLLPHLPIPQLGTWWTQLSLQATAHQYSNRECFALLLLWYYLDAVQCLIERHSSSSGKRGQGVLVVSSSWHAGRPYYCVTSYCQSNKLAFIFSTWSLSVCVHCDRQSVLGKIQDYNVLASQRCVVCVDITQFLYIVSSSEAHSVISRYWGIVWMKAQSIIMLISLQYYWPVNGITTLIQDVLLCWLSAKSCCTLDCCT